MSFLSVVFYNIAAMSIGVFSAACVGTIVLKKLSFGGRKYEYKRIFVLAAYCIFMAVISALFYKTGLLRNDLVCVLVTYIRLIGDAFCISLLFRERFQVCWGIVVFNGIVTEFAQIVSFSVALKREAFHISITAERIEYIFRSMVMGPIIYIFLLFLLYKLKVGKAYIQWMEHGNTWIWGMLCLSAYPGLIRWMEQLLINSGMALGRSMVLTAFMLLGMLIIFNYMGREEKHHKELIEQQINLQQQNAYIETLEEMQEEMRRFRHDYKNMMSGMYLQAKEGKLTEISDFIQEMTEDFDSQVGGQIRKLSQLRNIYMTEVKGLLLTKLKEMDKDGIICELEVMHPFYGTAFKATDLCRCLGILIDNAMDEVRGKEDAQVHIMISSQKDFTTFRVKNTLYHTVDFYRIWKKGYSTRGKERGIGLASYKKILEQYDYVLPVTTVQKGCFIQELKIQERNKR